MVNITLSVPKELKNQMDGYKIINWSEVARQAFKQKIGDMEFLDEFKSNSDLSEKDALRLGAKVNEALAKRYKVK